jgi:hypothetical protein
MHLEKATLHYDLAAFADNVELMPLKILTANGKVVRPKLIGADEISAFEAEIREAAQAIASGKPSSILSADLAQDAIILCHKQTEAVRRGKAVKV